MDEKVQNANATGLTPRQQRLLLRAVVGSLVISAALAAPPASSQTLAAPAQEARSEVAGSPGFNTKPLAELLAKAARLHADGLISWEDTFEITFEAERASDGALHNLNVTSVAAVNRRWPELMRELAAALGESRVLGQAFQDFERLSLTFKLDPRGAFAGLSFEAPTEKRASQLQAGYGMLLHLVAQTKRGRPEEPLFRGARVTANGKQFAVTLEVPREQLGNLLSTTRAIP